MKNRLLFLDILRIGSILAIVAFHIGKSFGVYPFTIEFPFYPLAWISLGQLGVYVLLFVSGASLAYSHSTKKVFTDLRGFYTSRFLRIYPAFWISMAFAILIPPWISYNISPSNVIPIITGFTAFVGEWSGPINNVYWFIGLIVVLYLMYPFISKFIDWNPNAAMITLIEISLVSTLALVYFNIGGAAFISQGVTRWFPLCNLAVFGAGVYCIRTGHYPDWTSSNELLSGLVALSFFFFLYHDPMIFIAHSNLLIYLAALVIVSMWAMMLDNYLINKIHRSTDLSGKIQEDPTVDHPA